jgi:hypothetical protein
MRPAASLPATAARWPHSASNDHSPVMVAKGWSDAKKRAYVIADNKLALNAGWDNEMLAA